MWDGHEVTCSIGAYRQGSVQAEGEMGREVWVACMHVCVTSRARNWSNELKAWSETQSSQTDPECLGEWV